MGAYDLLSRCIFSIAKPWNRKNNNELKQKKHLLNGPKIVAIGGGTGLSSMLRGLKAYSSNITAVVTVADDGGGSGVLRQDLGMPPPGDIRNCIVALANTEPIMEQLMQYRFNEGMLKGQSFGNLFLAAMDGISSSFEEAVRRMSDVLAVTGRVLPVTLEDVRLFAELEDGYVVCGESNIGRHNAFHPGRIKRVYMEPQNAKPLDEAVNAIEEADIIVLGPGSLYTSIIPNLLVNNVFEAIKSSRAIKVYVCNIMTQPGETENYTLSEHIKAIEKHSCKGIIDYCLANASEIPPEINRKYLEDGAKAVEIDADKLHDTGIKVICGDFVSIKNNFIRHDPKKLAEAVMKIGGISWNLANRTGAVMTGVSKKSGF
ncbi:MAG: YvcK family protein [Clostridia bacterium]|nr:YvcK family protein [Clostridia bacterium]